MVQSLNSQGVPVALVVPFDGTGSYYAPKNVACVLNLTQRRATPCGARASTASCRMSMSPGEPGIDHLTIDEIAAAARHGAELDPAGRALARLSPGEQQPGHRQPEAPAGAENCSAKQACIGQDPWIGQDRPGSEYGRGTPKGSVEAPKKALYSIFGTEG